MYFRDYWNSKFEVDFIDKDMTTLLIDLEVCFCYFCFSFGVLTTIVWNTSNTKISSLLCTCVRSLRYCFLELSLVWLCKVVPIVVVLEFNNTAATNTSDAIEHLLNDRKNHFPDRQPQLNKCLLKIQHITLYIINSKL